MEDRTVYQSEAWSDALDEKVIELRKRWLDFSNADELLVKEIDALIQENIDPLIDDMYAHFLSFDQTKKFFPDEATLHRAQTAQKRYFLRLCQGNYDRAYVAERLAVGETHYRIGLDPTWYLGAYNRVFAWCRRLVREKYQDDAKSYFEVIGALTRLVFFDMGLAIEAYSIAKEDALRRQQDAIDQQREDFVATLTHDLKTPILAANRAIKLLIEGDFGKVEESQQRILETIHQSNEAMYLMVQTLLDVYRYDSGLKNLSLVQTDLGAMAASMVAGLSALATTHGITLTADIPDKVIPVRCDDTEIRRVLQNVVDNALKFTPEGGSITIRLRQTADSSEVAVEDTGKGIPEEDKPKLFQRFWAAASSGRYYASTGLGLYLCRKIIESHGGSIWVESQLGRGSTFHFRIANDTTQT